MLKGMTVEYLLNRTYEVQSGDIILFHAISGGVGNIACQWAKHLGAKVIGTVGSPEKAELARANGCDYVVEYRRESFLDLVMEVTNGQGVPVQVANNLCHHRPIFFTQVEVLTNCLSPGNKESHRFRTFRVFSQVW